MTYAWKLPNRTLHIGRRPLLMGIINVTPDSFSDGGRFLAAGKAIEHGLKLIADGADLLDIGGESTRPGSKPIALEEELRRVEPVFTELAKATTIPLSADTSKAAVAAKAMELGASVINDVTGLAGDPAMAAVAKDSGAGLVVMHMQGAPETMQLDPKYADVVKEVRDWLEARLLALAAAGVEPERVAIDPGIGFGKRQEHNLALLARLGEVRCGDRPICLGASRKGFINRALGKTGASETGSAGTIGVALQAVSRGAAQILRVHDVREVHEALSLFLAIEEAAPASA